MAGRPLAAVLLAAGKGTRMRSEMPKVLHPLAGLPLLAHPLLRVLELGASPVVVVVGYGASQVEAAFDHLRDRVTFAVQHEQLGTGHATLMAREALQDFDGDVLIMPGDAPLIRASSLRAFVEDHRRDAAPLTVLTTKVPDAAHYGRIVRGPGGGLEKIVEAKDATPEERAIQEINSGIYLVDARFLFAALARVRNFNAQGEYYLTDIVGLAREDGLNVRAFLHGNAEELAGVNDRLELAKAEAWLRDETNRRHMVSGVTFIDPLTTRIETTVGIEPDVILHPGVHLRGRSHIGRGCLIEPGAVLTDVRLEPGVRVGAYAVLTGVEIGQGSRIEAHAVLEGGAIGKRARVGAHTVLSGSHAVDGLDIFPKLDLARIDRS